MISPILQRLRPQSVAARTYIGAFVLASIVLFGGIFALLMTVGCGYFFSIIYFSAPKYLVEIFRRSLDPIFSFFIFIPAIYMYISSICVSLFSILDHYKNCEWRRIIRPIIILIIFACVTVITFKSEISIGVIEARIVLPIIKLIETDCSSNDRIIASWRGPGNFTLVYYNNDIDTIQHKEGPLFDLLELDLYQVKFKTKIDGQYYLIMRTY